MREQEGDRRSEYEAYLRLWPMNVLKMEVWDGVFRFYVGEGDTWTEGDVARAERAFPGWKAGLLHENYVLTLTPPGHVERVARAAQRVPQDQPHVREVLERLAQKREVGPPTGP